jgi:hypothetical protein
MVFLLDVWHRLAFNGQAVFDPILRCWRPGQACWDPGILGVSGDPVLEEQACPEKTQGGPRVSGASSRLAH